MPVPPRRPLPPAAFIKPRAVSRRCKPYVPSPPDTLARNLDALRGRHPALAERLAAAAPAPLAWSVARNGQPTAALPADDTHPTAISLASRFDPAAEAAKLLAPVDFAKTACVVLLGLGLGYHATLAAERLGDAGLLIVHEPDTATLRAVLERLDLAALFARPTTVLLGESDGRAALTQHTERFSHLITQGTQLVAHSAGRRRFAAAYDAFGKLVADHAAYCRTNVATALVNAARTCRNLAANLDVYAAGATTDDLLGAAAGYPAVCVGAGPSLVKNVDLLRDPAVRRNVVVIAVQTTLKPLLDRGIRPDFVTALDYSPICARFYEGLPDLPDVTLVAEPKANAAILDAFPGPIRIIQNNFNDLLLGDPAPAPGSPPGLARRITPIRGGATVAHLSYYLARHLGCDPVMFIGQDLGFSDGLYYAPGTAVHQVWDCELNAFNTLEMMEWQRVARMRGNLRRFDDVHGRPIYSDEQMVTYLRQFERDFAEAERAGQRVLDCTEGGMLKEHTTRTTLAEALAEHATRPVPPLPVPPRKLDAERLSRLDALLQRRVAEVTALREMSDESVHLVRRMQRAVEAADQKKLDRLFTQLDRNRKRVEGDLREAFALVNQLNTIGAFRRSRADRGIASADASAAATDRYAKLSKQLDRDGDNIKWILEACDEALAIFGESRARLSKRLRDDSSDSRDATRPRGSQRAAA